MDGPDVVILLSSYGAILLVGDNAPSPPTPVHAKALSMRYEEDLGRSSTGGYIFGGMAQPFGGTLNCTSKALRRSQVLSTA